jgi:phytoene dehydrogenase-like protein
MERRVEIVVIGAGLAGLAAAFDLQAAGREVLVVEKAATPGGRVATDVVHGFRLDRGFQVLSTAYPQVRRRLDLDALRAVPLTAGALVRYDGKLRRIGNPLRDLTSAPATVGDHLLPMADLLHLGGYSARTAGPLRRMASEDVSADDAFRTARLNGAASQRFLRPFLSGVLLEDALSTSRRFVDLVWRTFVRGRSVLPADGMGSIGDQLAGRLTSGTVEFDTPVTTVRADAVETAEGTIRARHVVVATDPATAARWARLTTPTMRSVTTYYHCPPQAPLREATIVLDGERSGPVINSVVLTAAVPGYAPDGRALVSSSVLDDDGDEGRVRRHLAHLYGCPTDDWELVDRVAVDQALPAFLPGSPLSRPATVDGVYVAGDHRATPSIQGALASGTAAARAILAG